MLSISEVSIYSWFGWQRAPLAGWCGPTPLLADGWTPLTDWSAGQHVTQKHSGYWPDRMRLRLMVKPDVLRLLAITEVLKPCQVCVLSLVFQPDHTLKNPYSAVKALSSEVTTTWLW